MKILKIKFKNINNLKGEHEAIHFDQEPLSSAGIFAITGPTGSGKSTLLDVITLSLFNRIPRYKKIITKNELESLGSVVTHHTNDAYALVEYEIKGNRYTSEWKVAKNRNGKFKDYEMFIYDVTGQPLDLKKSEVPAKNESLIGLQYDQFVKSIILSQGEFSKFLKANKDERGKLLENITGTSIYRKIGIKVFEKNKEIKAQLATKKQILEGVKTLSEEELESISKDLKDQKSKVDVLDKVIKQLSENIKIKKDLQDSSSAIVSLTKDASLLSERRESFKTTLHKLIVHNKLNPVKDDIALYKDAKNNKVQTEKNLHEYKLGIKTAEEGLKKCLEEMSTISKKQVDEKNFMKVMGDFEKEILALDKDMEISKTKGSEIRDRLNKQKENYPDNLAKQPEEALPILTNIISILKKKIEASKLHEKSSIAETRTLMKNNRANYDALLLIKHDQDHLRETKSKIKKIKGELLEQETSIKQKKPLKIKTEELVRSYKDQLSILEKRKEDAIKIASLEEHRGGLVKGDPCPLCGSKEHPYSVHKPESNSSEIEKQIEKLNTNLLKQEEELKNLINALTGCEASIKIIDANLKETEVQLTNTQEKLNSKKENYPNKKDLDEEKIGQVISKLEIEINNLDIGVEALSALGISKEIKISYTELQKELENYSNIKSIRQEKFAGEKIEPVTNRLQNDFQKHRTSIAKINVALKKETKDLDRANASLEMHKIKLQPKLETLGFDSIEEMSLNFLNEDEANAIREQENEIKKRLTENETQLNLHKEAIVKLQKADKLPEKSYEDLQKESLIQDQQRKLLNQDIGSKQNQINADKEQKENQKSQRAEIEKLNLELEKWSLLDKMIGDAKGNKFSNYSQGLTLQNLLVYANHRLQNLTDRYLLDRPSEEGPLRVVDQFQGNTHRSVSTLSGGESFLISLALALSLSDMASRNVSIESLFIDEGFGTLDQETLDVAMNTLEKLQSESQKMVGVISHVEALKERITVQIKLEKNAQGFSQIQIV